MIKKLLPVMIALIVSGCVAVPNLEAPSIELQNIQTQNKEIYQVKRDGWWTELNNAQLNQLMVIVLDNNKDLKLLNIKIAKIQEQYQLTNAGRKAAVDFNATAKKQRSFDRGIFCSLHFKRRSTTSACSSRTIA